MTYHFFRRENIQAPYQWHYFDPVAEQQRGCCEVLRQLVYGPRFWRELPWTTEHHWPATCVNKGLMSWDTHVPMNLRRCYITDEGREYLAACEKRWKKDDE